MQQFQEERMTVCAANVVGLQRCIEQTIEYARTRRIFGKSVLDHQSVHFRLAELLVEVEAYRCARLTAAGRVHLAKSGLCGLCAWWKSTWACLPPVAGRCCTAPLRSTRPGMT
jgi:alkylation response protein AidB-like acyl-CoA dehydrogenase